MADFETHPVGTAKELRVLRSLATLMIDQGYAFKEDKRLSLEVSKALKEVSDHYIDEMYYVNGM
jgi:hypothetical protein